MCYIWGRGTCLRGPLRTRLSDVGGVIHMTGRGGGRVGKPLRSGKPVRLGTAAAMLAKFAVAAAAIAGAAAFTPMQVKNDQD